MQQLVRGLFSHFSFYFIFAIFLTWIIHLAKVFRSEQFSFKDFLKKNRVGLSLCLVFSILCFLAVPPTYRTLSDETNLVSVSQSMLRDRTSDLTIMAFRYFGKINPVISETPTRPLMFSFFVFLLHSLLGYSPKNAYLLNFISLFSYLSLIFIVVRKRASFQVALASILLVMSYPVLIFAATSAGFDLFASLFFALSLLLTFVFLIKPSSERFGLLVATLVLFANTRYESVGFLFVILGLLAVFRKITREHLQKNLSLIVSTPFLLFPLVVQRYLGHGKYQNSPGVAVFSRSHIVTNLTEFWTSLWDFRFVLPYASGLTLVALFSFVLLIVTLWFQRQSLKTRVPPPFLAIACFCVILNVTIYLAYYFGNYIHPASTRFYITLSTVFALTPIALHLARPGFLKDSTVLLFSIVVFFIYFPTAVDGRFTSALDTIRERTYEIEFLKAHPNPELMILSDRPGLFTVDNYGAADFDFANKRTTQILNDLKRHAVNEIYAFQKISYATGNVTPETILDPIFKLEKQLEIQISDREYLRISSVKQ